MKGTIKWYNYSRGFGFILGEDGKVFAAVCGDSPPSPHEFRDLFYRGVRLFDTQRLGVH